MLAHEPSAKRGGTGSLYLEINEKRMHNMLLYYNDGARYIRRAPRHKVDKVAAAGFCSSRTWICHPSSRVYPTISWTWVGWTYHLPSTCIQQTHNVPLTN